MAGLPLNRNQDDHQDDDGDQDGGSHSPMPPHPLTGYPHANEDSKGRDGIMTRVAGTEGDVGNTVGNDSRPTRVKKEGEPQHLDSHFVAGPGFEPGPSGYERRKNRT
jgi:hypothetical protein